jgi:signal transduction histidine kinase
MRAAHHLARLVEDVVDLGRANIGPLDLGPVSVPEAVNEAIGMVKQAHGLRPICVRTYLSEGLPPVVADRPTLARCLRHLVDNAVKFSPAGSEVQVQAEVAQDSNFVRFSVRDQGDGIPAAELEKVFEGFYQVDGSTTRRHDGAGVGLALVKMLLEAQGASIAVESVVGRGSLFYFQLPIADGR